SSRRRHTRSKRDWSSDVCSSDLLLELNLFRLRRLQILLEAFTLDSDRAPTTSEYRGPDRSQQSCESGTDHGHGQQPDTEETQRHAQTETRDEDRGTGNDPRGASITGLLAIPAVGDQSRAQLFRRLLAVLLIGFRWVIDVHGRLLGEKAGE